MNRLFVQFVIICLLPIVSVVAQKRGIAYGYHSPEDLEVQSPATTWWYNWSEAPESTVANNYLNYGFEFVPMTWNGNYNITRLRNFLINHPETKYLLAFNEPNFVHQANLTPQQAAALWPALEAVADEFNLKLVAPAVNYCDVCVEANGVVYSDPVTYLDDFFAACSGCRVDYIAVHSYMNTVGALQWYLNRFKKYQKPIWLTEFAGWENNGNINNPDDQINFMIGAVDMLEYDSAIFRYSWFIGRGPGINNYPFIDILGANGVLTPIGEIYKQMPVHDPDQIIQVPALIQAENYNHMNGILIERTSDVSGFANVGYIEAGDWLEYMVEVPQTAEYHVILRIASTKVSSLKLLIDGVEIKEFNLPNTSGWQNWETFAGKAGLASGIHTIRLKAATDGFNINWFQIAGETYGVNDHFKQNSGLNVHYGNCPGLIHISGNDRIEKLQIGNLFGSDVLKIPFSPMIDLNDLPSGIYTLTAMDKDNRIIGHQKITLTH